MTRSYVTNLRKGRIESPGYEKMAAIAETMGFSPGAWFEQHAGKEPTLDLELAGVLRDKTIRDTAREMSRMSKREQRLVLGIVRQFGEANSRGRGK